MKEARLDRVTITGADDGTDPHALWELAREFPFVEWGILYSLPRPARPRFPSHVWLQRLFDYARRHQARPQFALHCCGQAVVRLLEGSPSFVMLRLTEAEPLGVPIGLLQLCRRLQINTHGEDPMGWAPHKMAAFWKQTFPCTQLIQQIDGAHGPAILESLLAEEVDVSAFYDLSHGAGIAPAEWPRAQYMANDVDVAYHGYGGGLGPDNLAEELPRIVEAARGGRFWIDMETKVRGAGPSAGSASAHAQWVGSRPRGGDTLDLAKVRRCLEIARPFVAAR